jgi:hypothetical protein
MADKPEYYAILPKDYQYIRDLRSRLFSEKRMTADDMRTAANRLELIIRDASPLDLDEENRLVEFSPSKSLA